ncbi:radial spoke head protein 6 homolog A [Nilaparvata lugens]|uniref:radial spoke head protein 6 homolog A n=1 Tax=Nilaparvata lugens TaxID=108931 RepID=UPI00193E115D|nr:radial spoke head protein 6 homolog A [Nilaparvata lugens]
MSLEIERDETTNTSTTEDENIKDEQLLSDMSSSLDSPNPSALLLDRIPSQTLHKCSFAEAKSFLSKCEGSTNDSLWNHLSDLISKILEERPVNVIDFLEEYSSRVKRERFEISNNHIQKVYVHTSDLDYARRNIELIKAAEIQQTSEIVEDVNEEETEDGGATASDIKMGFLQFMSNFRQAGVGLSKDDSFLINLSLIKLQKTQPVLKYKFWGKIFGLKKDYLIAECDLTKEEIERRDQEEQDKLAGEKEQEEKDEEEKKLMEEEEQKQKEEEERIQSEQMKENPSEDKSDENRERSSEEKEKVTPVVPLREQYKRPKTPEVIEEVKPEVESEPPGEGINKKVYFVCNEPGDDWIELPNVTPKQIQIARKIKRYFTGDLETEINTYPIFPGNEKNYLRAQIARISSSTHISPLGYYTFHNDLEEEEEEENDEDEEEEEEKKMSFVSNSQYEPASIEELTDPSMSFWVHHAFHLLKQGRATFWKPKPIKDEEEGEEAEEEQEEEEEEEGEGEEVAEEALPLLTPLSGDTCLETRTMWSVRQTSTYAKENAVAFVVSNLWPGAYAFASGRSYGNIYIGWGHKYLARGYSPAPLPHPEEEYEIGPEVMEMTDPTPEMEEEWREKQRKKEMEKVAETEGEEEEEEEEEGDEDDEDDD